MQEFSTNKLEGEKMDLQNIQEQLNNEFSKEDTRIIFWFYSKWLLNESDTENKYLVWTILK